MGEKVVAPGGNPPGTQVGPTLPRLFHRLIVRRFDQQVHGSMASCSLDVCPAPVRECFFHLSIIQPFRSADSFHSGIGSVEHLFGPACDVFVTRDLHVRLDLRVHQYAAGIPSIIHSEAYFN
jgi:hypothetical protein